MKEIQLSILSSLLYVPSLYYQHMANYTTLDYITNQEIKECVSCAVEIIESGKALNHQSLKAKAPIYTELINESLDKVDIENFGWYIKSLVDNYRTDQLKDKVQYALLGETDEIRTRLSSALTDYDSVDLSTSESIEKKMTSWMDRIILARTKKGMAGTPTGLDRLDELTDGWQPSDLVIIGARPSMGKTTFMIQSALECCLHGKVCLIFSLEISEESIYHMIWAKRTGKTVREIRKGIIADKDLFEVMEWSKNLPLKVFDNIYEIDKIKSVCIGIGMNIEIGGIFIDHLAYIRGYKGQNRNHELAYYTKELKTLGKLIYSPVILLSQLSRDLTKRADKRPVLSDLRDSGEIEQDADLVIFIHRDSYYDPDYEDATTEFIIRKQRHGELGIVYADFNINNFSSKSETQFTREVTDYSEPSF